MRIIDANSGADVVVGDTFTNIDGEHTLLAVQAGIFYGKALLRTTTVAGDYPTILLGERWVPLQIRYLHPNFMFQKVGFIPS